MARPELVQMNIDASMIDLPPVVVLFWSAMASESQRAAYRPPASQDHRLAHAIQISRGSRNIDVNEPREPVSVVVDYRERNSGVLGALATMAGVDVGVEHLPVGDYFVDDVFVFERKTLVDLVASIKDARLLGIRWVVSEPTATYTGAGDR